MMQHSAPSNDMHRRHGPRGFTLTEIAIVLATIGLLVGGLWAVASDVWLSHRVRVTSQQLAATAQNIRSIYADLPGIKGTLLTATPALDQLKAFPPEMRQEAAGTYGNVFHIFSSTPVSGLGSVQVQADDCTGANPVTAASCFDLTYYNMPQKPCEQLLLLSQPQGTGLAGVAVNPAGGPPYALVSPPLSLNNADAACTSATANNMIWIYNLRDN